MKKHLSLILVVFVFSCSLIRSDEKIIGDFKAVGLDLNPGFKIMNININTNNNVTTMEYTLKIPETDTTAIRLSFIHNPNFISYSDYNIQGIDHDSTVIFNSDGEYRLTKYAINSDGNNQLIIVYAQASSTLQYYSVSKDK